MAKLRVYELARDLNIDNKSLLERLNILDIPARNHVSSLDSLDIEKVKKDYQQSGDKIKKMPKPDSISAEASKRMRAEIDEIINAICHAPKLLEKHILIREGETGWTYEKIFGHYLQGAEVVTLIDSYIRKEHQIWNFERFCELAIKTNTVEEIRLITYFDDNYQKKRSIEKFDSLKKSLCKNGIDFTWSFKANEHDRFILLDNGWCINIGFGLDIYKKPDRPFTTSKFDLKLRPCKKTVVHIFKATRLNDFINPK